MPTILSACRRYLVALVAGATLPFAAIVAVVPWLQGADVPEGRWVSQALERKLALAREKPHRVLILGGSNALFGFSARHLEVAHGVSAVNAAVHINLRRRYIFHYGLGLVNRGDLVVMPLEYELYERPLTAYPYVYHVLTRDQEYLHNLPLADRIQFLCKIPPDYWAALLKARLLPDDRPVGGYDVRNLNAWGDETSNVAANVRAPIVASLLRDPPKQFRLERAALEDIADFQQDVKARGGRIVVTYPTILRSALDMKINSEFLDDVRNGLREFGVDLIGDPLEMTFDPALAFDTRYHPVREGQLRNTETLYRELLRAKMVD